MTEYFPTVVQVIPLKNYHVKVFFDDGKITEYDMTDKITNGIFKVLQDVEIFIKTCTILNDTLAWDIMGNRNEAECIDIDPFTLYELPTINSDENNKEAYLVWM